MDKLDEIIKQLTHEGRYSEAISYAKKVLENEEKVLNKNHPFITTSLNNLAVLYIYTGNYTEAEALLKRSLKIREKTVGKNHPEVAAIFNNLAALYKETGKYSEAEQLLNKSIEVYEHLLGRNHLKVAMSLNNLAEIYRITGKYLDAEQYYKRSLNIYENSLGKGDHNVATSLNNLALLYGEVGKYSEAESLFIRSLQIREKALGKTHPYYSQSLNNLTELYKRIGRYSEAKLLHLITLQIRESEFGKNHTEVANSLKNLGQLYRETGRYSEAEPLYRRALQVIEDALGKNHPDIADILNQLDLLYYKKEKSNKKDMEEIPDDMIPALLISFLSSYPKQNNQYLHILLAHPKTKKIATNLLEGSAQSLSVRDFEMVGRSGDFLNACGNYLMAYGINRGKKDFLNVAINLFEESRQYMKRGKEDYAISLMSEGIAKSILAWHKIDIVDNSEKAIELFERAKYEGLEKHSPMYAVAIIGESGPRTMLAGFGIDPVKNLKKAIELCKRAMNEGLVKDTPYYGLGLISEGIATWMLAEFGIDPVDNYKKAIELCRRARYEGYMKNTPDHGRALVSEGNALEGLARLGIDPVDNYRKAIELIQRARNEGLVKDNIDYAGALMSEGNVLEGLAGLGIDPVNNYRKAIELCNRARNEGFVKDTPTYALALNYEGIAWLELANIGIDSENTFKKAIELFQKARNEGLKKDTPSYGRALMNEGVAWDGLAELGIESSDLNKAESIYLEAKDILKQVNDRMGVLTINNNIGYLKYFSNEMPKAYDYFKEAISLAEEIRTSIKIPELRKEYFETVVNSYKHMVFTCLAIGKDKYEEAFRYAESSKGRTFLELLANEKKRIKTNPEIARDYKDILMKIGEVEATIRKEIRKEEIQRLREELLSLERLHDNLLKKIKQNDPEYYSIKTVEPISLEELSKTLNGRILVEYFLGKKLAVFVFNGSLTVKIVEIDEKEISKKVFEFRELISKLEEYLENGINPDKTKEYEKAEEILKYFYKFLIEPIKDYLSKEKDIVIVPHSYLHSIPFQALKNDRYLIEDYKISFAQSASSLKFMKKGAGNGALVVGNPTNDLKHAEEEAIAVAKHLENTNLILGDNATKDRIMKEITGKEILHFSCHGKFNPFNPAFSGVLLSDGNLTAIDFMDLEINANLAVISACETALSKFTKGDEVEGLVRAIQYGGGRFVIASLWKVANKSTKELFLKFYTEGDIIDRLRNAELNLMKQYGFYYWAPFQVYGI